MRKSGTHAAGEFCQANQKQWDTWVSSYLPLPEAFLFTILNSNRAKLTSSTSFQKPVSLSDSFSVWAGKEEGPWFLLSFVS